jgi:hypothetical protein
LPWLIILSHLAISKIYTLIANLCVIRDYHSWRNGTNVSNLAAASNLAVYLKFITVADVTRANLTPNFKQVVVSNLHCFLYHIPFPIFPWLINNLHMIFYDAEFTKDNVTSIGLDYCAIMYDTPFSKVHIANNISLAAHHDRWRLLYILWLNT